MMRINPDCVPDFRKYALNFSLYRNDVGFRFLSRALIIVKYDSSLSRIFIKVVEFG